MQLNWIAIGGLTGALAVAIGAFGAHALPDQLEKLGYESADVLRRLDTFETGAQYQMYAALAMLAVGVAQRQSPRRPWQIANWLLLTGVAIFSGLLYALAVVGDEYRWLGAIVPIGGLMMIAGWAMIAWAGLAGPVSDSASQ